jgi:predicted transcriptional regulator
VLRRLTEKGWLACDKTKRTFSWQPLVSRSEAQVLEAYEQLQRFLAVGHPDIVAAFADSLDEAIYEQIEAIALHLKAIRQAKENQQ